MERRTLSLGDWLWNLLLYPLAYLAVAVATTTVELIFGGVYLSAYEGYPGDVLGFFVGLILWGFPALVVSLVLVAVAFRFGAPGSHRPIAVVVPVTVHGVYLAWLQPVYFTPWLGVALTLLPFLALGLATWIPRPEPSVS